MHREEYDLIVVGTGPGGIFTLMEVLDKRPEAKILVLEKGNAINKRSCPRVDNCIGCKSCAITAGWGGAGAFSDGKLTYAAEVGGWLNEIIGAEKLLKLYPKVDQEWTRFTTQNGDKLYDFIDEELKMKCQKAGIYLIDEKVRHLGTDRCLEILTNMHEFINNYENVTILHRAEATKILADRKNAQVTGVEYTHKRETYQASSPLLVIAPGRAGSEWLQEEMTRLNIPLKINPVDIGVRVETNAIWADPITKNVYEPKMVYYTDTFDDKVRTFCVNPRGEVVTESYGDVITVNGHSNYNTKTNNTNFALLVSTIFTEPFKEPTKYGKHVAKLANLLAEGVVVQRLGDLKRGRRSTPDRIAKGLVQPTLKAIPGDLSFVLPYRHLQNIVEMLEKMDEVAPGIGSKDTLLYGVEVKFYSSRPKIDQNFETPIKGLFTIGDGAGVTRGLSQASVNGIVVGRALVRRI